MYKIITSATQRTGCRGQERKQEDELGGDYGNHGEVMVVRARAVAVWW